MFDIGFSELIVVGVVALLVIGPERLPKVARAAGHMLGRFQRYASSVKADIGREMELDELRKAGQDFKDSIQSAVSGAETQANLVDDYLKNEIGQINAALTRTDDGPLDDEFESTVATPHPQQDLPLVAPPLSVVEYARPPEADKSGP